MANRLQNWIYNKGGYFWFMKWSHKVARRTKTWHFNISGVRYKWLTKLLRFVTGHKFSYWKDLQEQSDEQYRHSE